MSYVMPRISIDWQHCAPPCRLRLAAEFRRSADMCGFYRAVALVLALTIFIQVNTVLTFGKGRIECPEGCKCREESAICGSEWAVNETLRPSIGLRSLKLTKPVKLPLSLDSLFPDLEELEIEDAKRLHLNKKSLPPLPKLRTLRLSNDGIDEVNPGVFDDFKNLIELRLTKNFVTRLQKGLFREQQQLETLDLNRNKIRDIDDLIFQNLTKLRFLNLRRNGIETLKTGVFYGLMAVSSLRLDRNLITVVSKKWTFGLNTLVNLSLAKNAVTLIESNCWEQSRRLEELDLSDNKLFSVDANTFEHLSNLKTLRLVGNKISAIGESAFSHVSSLRFLDLADNEISWIVEDMNGPFMSLRHLTNLSLADNHIKSIGDHAFRDLDSLVTLNLDGNNITSLQEHAFEALPSLTSLQLNASSLICDCNLQWFPRWIQHLERRESVAAVCAYPMTLQNMKLIDLKVENLTCDDSPKPKIVDYPKSLMAIKGETIKLRCEAISSSSSEMNFVWRRNNANITNSRIPKPSLLEDGSLRSVSELTLIDISDADAGKYQCIVSNGYGTIYSKKFRIAIVILPKFTKTPKNVTVPAGETIRLECAASGKPSPEIFWRKDEGSDFPAARERRMHVMPTDDIFFISNSKTIDNGVYSCTAKNSAGSVVSFVTVTVLEEPFNPVKNKEVIAGNSVVIECLVSGSPKPSLHWLKDRVPIVPTERHFFTGEDKLLIIVNTIPSDEGLYECEIANSLSTVRDSTELRVFPATTSVFNNDDDMMGIIIITVVCCAVATSIVWVVIIYHTRKRLKKSAVKYSHDALQLAPLSINPDSPQIFSDNISEKSSCKDSGTGDSAKRGSLEAVPAEDPITHISDSNVIIYINPPHVIQGEKHSLMKKDTRVHYDKCNHSMSIQMHRVEDNAIDVDSNRTYPYS